MRLSRAWPRSPSRLRSHHAVGLDWLCVAKSSAPASPRLHPCHRTPLSPRLVAWRRSLRYYEMAAEAFVGNYVGSRGLDFDKARKRNHSRGFHPAPFCLFGETLPTPADTRISPISPLSGRSACRRACRPSMPSSSWSGPSFSSLPTTWRAQHQKQTPQETHRTSTQHNPPLRPLLSRTPCPLRRA